MLKKLLGSTFGCISLLVILTIPLIFPILGSHLINGHDSMAALVRAMSMDRYMGHGQFLVRWSPDINWGYGYPMFNFYPPFFSMISVLFYHMTQNMVQAMNWACILFWVLSAIGMFLFAKEFWGNEGGMLSAILYIYAPYHIMDLYVRGAYAEFTSFAFFPFLLLSILKMCQNPTKKAFLLGIASVFGLSLTHNIMSMLFFPICILFLSYLYLFNKRGPWIFPAILIFIIGLMMSSFFWLPALLEKRYLNLNFILYMHYDFHENFISLRKLFWPFKVWTMDHISFQAGLIHTVLGLGTLICLPRLFKSGRRSGLVYIFFLIVCLGAVFCTLSCSHLLWEHITLLDYVQFPWRFLTIIVFAMSFLAGSVLILFKNSNTKVTFLIIASLLSIVFYIGTTPRLGFLDKLQSIDDFLALGKGEYTPRWVAVPPESRPARKFEIVHGRGQLALERSTDPTNYQTKINASEPSLLCFHTFYFPGWKVFIDGQRTKPYLNNPYGLILFVVPPGIHDIHVMFGSTPIRDLGMVISWMGVFMLLISLFGANLLKGPKT